MGTIILGLTSCIGNQSVSSGIAKWILANMSNRLSFKRSDVSRRSGLGVRSGCVFWRGGFWELLEGTWDYFLESDTAAQRLEYQEYKPAL